jgi:SAM-dependent methyltransferase
VRRAVCLLMRGIKKGAGNAVWLHWRMRRSLRQRGVLGTVRNAPAVVTNAAFDPIHGVDTGGYVHPSSMHDVESANRIYGNKYDATKVCLFKQVTGASDIEPHCYTFIDYGSGKGRVLLLASQLPFRRVVGVEYSPTMHQIAEQNLRVVRFAKRRSGPVESVCEDAVRFQIPEEPVVLYFFNPFTRQIMESVRDNLVRSYEGNPRSIVVIYHHPKHSDVWDAVDFLKRHAWSRSSDYVIYKSAESGFEACV